MSFDVLIVGAGPGGSATAHYLAQAGARVLLLDRVRFPRDKTCGDGLTPRAVGALEDMGLLGMLATLGTKINRFEIVAPNRNTTGALISETGTASGMSFVLPRFLLDEQVLKRARESGAHFEPDVNVRAISADAHAVAIQAERGGEAVRYQAKLGVIATGANSKLLLDAGILKRMPPTMVAARAYYDGVRGISDVWQLRFDHVTLPGYGWIFPTGPDSANIGAGFYAPERSISAADTFKQFVANPALKPMLDGAVMRAPMKGFPLRVDFARAPTHAPGVLLVGEAAGLVNPLTGEGIDYAIESGRVAAMHLMRALGASGLDATARAAYDADLRERYQSLFEFCEFVRDRLCGRAWLLNILVSLANRRTRLRNKLAQVVLGGRAINGRLTTGRMIRAGLSGR